jgi:hypothetical protein
MYNVGSKIAARYEQQRQGAGAKHGAVTIVLLNAYYGEIGCQDQEWA